MACITLARFGMMADVLRLKVDANNDGHWEYQQDSDSGAIIRVWVADSNPTEPGTQQETFTCYANGVLSSGIQAVGTTQRFSEIYENIDWVKMTLPKEVFLKKNDKVTNIRNAKTGEVIWKEEEMQDSPATIFIVRGVTPVTDPWSNHIEDQALLERSEIQ